MFSPSSPWSTSSSCGVKEVVKNKVEIIDDENEAESVWKSILKRKGLPLDTKYEYVDTYNKPFDESYCDMLYLTIEEKKKNPEAAKSWGASTFEWLPPPSPPPPKFSSLGTYHSDFDKRKPEKIIFRGINHIVYRYGSEAAIRRSQLSEETMRNFKELQPHATFVCNFKDFYFK